MKKPKIYIAGKVTGEARLNCEEKFFVTENVLAMYGFEVVNPINLVSNWETPWDKAMKICIKGLMDCDGLFLIKDFTESPGAKLELYLATLVNIPTFNSIEALKAHYEAECNNIHG